nr:MAG TPA: hypothetical protein [Caudoviricetes sp.]
MKEKITVPLDDIEDMNNEIFSLKCEIDRLRESVKGYRRLLDIIERIAPETLNKALDMQ